MALTDEQQQQVDMQKEISDNQAINNAAERAKQTKFSCMNMAQCIIFENRRVKAASEVSDITASDITTLADSLNTYANS